MSRFLYVVVPSHAASDAGIQDARRYIIRQSGRQVPHNLLLHLRITAHECGNESCLELFFGSGALYPTTRTRRPYAQAVLESSLQWARSRECAPYVLLVGHKRSMARPMPIELEMSVQEILESRAALPHHLKVAPRVSG